jgi:ABC-type transporter Mla MlaB component
MLKITVAVLTTQRITLQLDGRLAGRWVELLRDTATSVLDQGLSVQVDLRNISFIDCEGIVLLKSLIDRGVSHVNAPLFVAEQIRKCTDVHDQ